MTSPVDILESAYKDYMAANNRVAVLGFRHAASEAREYNDGLIWYKATVWSSEALYSLGDLRGAFDAMMMARAEEPPGAEFEHWLCRKIAFKVWLSWQPVRGKLEAALDDLETFHRRSNYPKHDISIFRGEFAVARGLWEEALRYFEKAAAVFEGSEPGATKNGFAYAAALCCIKLRRFSATEDWIGAIYDEREWERGFETSIACYQAGARLTLARAKGADARTLERLLREFDDACAGADKAEFRDHLLRERVRVGLMDSEAGDPDRSLHRSRNACRELRSAKLDSLSQFERSVLLLDYRLACLRFAVGLDQIDDEFAGVTAATVTVKIADPNDFLRRLQHAYASARRARRCAVQLDAMLECDWRAREVDRRDAHIRIIAAAAAP
jgi:tetratricopeptide (TPR) repeat protein